MPRKWYDKNPEQLRKIFNTDLHRGLSSSTARARLKRDGANIVSSLPRITLSACFRQVAGDVTLYLLFATALLSALFNRDISAKLIVYMVIFNVAVIVFTYYRSQRILEKTGSYFTPTVKVLRNGKLTTVSAEEIVRGDIITVSSGDVVPADARLIASDGLFVAENALTDSTAPVKKDHTFIEWRALPISERKNMLYASTVVMEGYGQAVVCATGEETEICRMGKGVPKATHQRLRVLRILRKYCSAWSITMLAMIFFLTFIDLITGLASRGLFNIFMTGISLASAAMSELYVVFGYVIIGLGIYGLMKHSSGKNHGAVIKNLESLQTIKGLTTVILQKEEGFCSRDLNISRIYYEGTAYKLGERNLSKHCGRLIEYAIVSTGLYGSAASAIALLSDSGVTPEEKAIIDLANDYGLYNDGLGEKYPMIDHVEKSASNDFETTLLSTESTNRTILRGELLPVLNQCKFYSDEGIEYPLTEERRQKIIESANIMSGETTRVIAVATKATYMTDLKKLSTCQSSMCFIGFFVINEPLMPDIENNIKRCADSGIKVIMLCRDISDSNKRTARKIGVLKEGQRSLTTFELYDIMKKGGDEYFDNIGDYRMYEALTARQKTDLIRMLRRRGEVVGFMGSELDDISAVNEADIGITSTVDLTFNTENAKDRSSDLHIRPRAESCTQAVKYLSDIMVTKPDKYGVGGFNSLTDAISTSKIIYQNLIRMVWYLMSSQIAKFTIVLFSVFSGIEFFTPIQILFCGLIVDLAAVIMIAFQRPPSDILNQLEDTELRLSRPFTKNMQSIFFGVLWGLVTVLTPIIIRSIGGDISEKQFITAAFISFIFSQYLILDETMKSKSLFSYGRKFNKVYSAALIFTLVFIFVLFAYPSVGALFGVYALSAASIPALILPPVILIAAFELYKKFAASGMPAKLSARLEKLTSKKNKKD
ncbi:MAG: cation-transporting P-type ATPase, partial [Clostridia bacterium]|nr:cation-transporting P-type ATPase [Clostridia bacterium]